jgi:hypothetical protein
VADVLVCGIYLADREHCAGSAIDEFALSRHHNVTQRWIALDISGTGSCDLAHTIKTVRQPTPKFDLINDISRDAAAFDYLLVCDDDVGFPAGFIDDYLGCVARLDLSLSQPARTLDSFIDHAITAWAPGLIGRVTRFVEIGPVVCVARRAFPRILPFDTRAPMGWGLDFVWPKLLEPDGLRLGIIDATPVSHVIRKPAQFYSRARSLEKMADLLKTLPHLPMTETYAVLEAHA